MAKNNKKQFPLKRKKITFFYQFVSPWVHLLDLLILEKLNINWISERINNTHPKTIYLQNGFVESPAHKSRTLSQPTEIAFNPDKVQIFPGKGLQTAISETVSQQAETAQSAP